jgi:prepilin-type N-terminal cleavage/methylation domain-containing protein
MLQKLNKNRGGFTLVEIMIVVAIIALLAAIAVPNFLRARKRSQATRCLEDLRVIDSACDQYAIENNKTTGNSVNWSDVQSYLKTGSVLYNSNGTDLFGNFYGSSGVFSVDNIPKLSSTTYGKLSDVAPLAFWSPYYP